MPRRSNRVKMDKLHRQRIVAELNRAGFNQMEIAAKVGAHQSTISKDLKTIGEEWLSRAVEDVEAAKKRELAEIDAHQIRAEDAWFRSVGTAIKIKRESGGVGEDDTGVVFKTVEEVEELVGDPRFLAEIRWCIEQRAKIWGIYAATRVEATGKDGGPIETKADVKFDYSKLTTDQLQQLIAIAESVEPKN